MATGTPPPRFPAPTSIREVSRNRRDYQLIGHSPDTPWWATLLGIALIVGIAGALLLLLTRWVR